MFAKINTAGLRGIEGFPVEVEADVRTGLPGFYLTGALSSETKEAQFRVMNALTNSGIRMEPKKVTVNFSPASVRKEGTAYDLPIAVAVLAGMGLADHTSLEDTAFFGETGLDGSLKRVRGALPLAQTCRDLGFARVVVPAENAAEAALADGIRVIGCGDLSEVLKLLTDPGAGTGEEGRRPSDGTGQAAAGHPETGVYGVDFSEVRGQAYLRRAAEIAVSGRHNILFSGIAGSGKTMIAKRMPTIMPELTREEDLEISRVYSICGLLGADRPLLGRRPFRSPHHGISEAAFAGGGTEVMPGEMSLASGGILFLDELPLFRRSTLEMLRQPLEEKRITVSRMKGSYSYPADFLLAAAMNNCPCGHYPDRSRCRCTKAQIRMYRGRLSKPLLERIDICAEARPVAYGELTEMAPSESSGEIRARVAEADRIQKERFRGMDGIRCNSQMGIRDIGRFCALGPEEKEFMQEVYRARSLSGRTYHKILKVARTIADMEGSPGIKVSHLAEAVGFRSLEDVLFPASGQGPAGERIAEEVF